MEDVANNESSNERRGNRGVVERNSITKREEQGGLEHVMAINPLAVLASLPDDTPDPSPRTSPRSTTAVVMTTRPGMSAKDLLGRVRRGSLSRPPLPPSPPGAETRTSAAVRAVVGSGSKIGNTGDNSSSSVGDNSSDDNPSSTINSDSNGTSVGAGNVGRRALPVKTAAGRGRAVDAKNDDKMTEGEGSVGDNSGSGKRAASPRSVPSFSNGSVNSSSPSTERLVSPRSGKVVSPRSGKVASPRLDQKSSPRSDQKSAPVVSAASPAPAAPGSSPPRRSGSQLKKRAKKKASGRAGTRDNFPVRPPPPPPPGLARLTQTSSEAKSVADDRRVDVPVAVVVESVVAAVIEDNSVTSAAAIVSPVLPSGKSASLDLEKVAGRARSQTATRFNPASVPSVQDGKDCVIVGTSLKGGTVQKVLEWLIFFEKNDDNVVDFIQCFDAFVPMWKVTSILRQVHDHYVDPANQASVRKFATRLFELRCRDDPSMEGAPELLSLMRDSIAAASTPRHLSLIKAVRVQKAMESSLQPPLLLLFMDLTPKSVAEALTRYQHEIFRCIGTEELVAWPLPSRGMAGYLASTDRELHNWAVMVVSLAPQPQLAARRLLQVMERLQSLHNYNALMCLALGLSRVSSLLTARQRAQLDTIAALVSPANNYRTFREHMATSPSTKASVFPIFDAYVGMLEFIHAEQAAYLGPSYINFRKVKVLGALFSQIKTYQNMRYDFSEHPRAHAYVLALGRIEPPVNHTLPLRPLNTAKELSRLSLQPEEASKPGTLTHNPLLSATSQAALKNLISPRAVVPPAGPGFVASALPDRKKSANLLAVGGVKGIVAVENPLYSPVAAKLPYRLQRETILLAYSRFLQRLGNKPNLPVAIVTVIHASRGARGPPVGESALFEPSISDEEQAAAAAATAAALSPDEIRITDPDRTSPQKPLIPPLVRGASLGSGLARVRDVLSPRGKEKSAASLKAKNDGVTSTTTTTTTTATTVPAPETIHLQKPLHPSNTSNNSDATDTTTTPINTDRGNISSPADMDVDGVLAWLASLSLQEHQAEFRENQINGTALLFLTEDDLRGMKVDKVGHRKQLLRGIGDLRTQMGLSAVVPIASPRRESADTAEGVGLNPEGTLQRRIARKQEQEGELYVKGVYKGTVRLMRLDASTVDVKQLYSKFKEEFGKSGVILYKDAEGDSISVEKASDLEYAIQDSALRGGIVKLSYSEA